MAEETEDFSETQKEELQKLCAENPLLQKLYEAAFDNEDPAIMLFNAYKLASKVIYEALFDGTLSKETEYHEACMQFCKDYKSYVQGGDLRKKQADLPPDTRARKKPVRPENM